MFPRLSARLRARRQFVIALLATAIPAATILPFVPSLTVEASSTPTLLGTLLPFYTLDNHQLWDHAALSVNVASGDLILHQSDLKIAGKAGHDLVFDRYYNSLSNGVGGGAAFGSHWVMTAGTDVKLTIGTSITYQGPSSFQVTFTSLGGGAWSQPAALDATLSGPNGSNQYTLTYHDNGQVLTFDSTGLLLSNADRNSGYGPYANTIHYGYTSGSLTSITDATGRVVSLANGSNGNIKTVTDPSVSPSRVLTYGYDGNHNLTSYADPTGNCGTTPVNCTLYGYDTSHNLTDIKSPAYNASTHNSDTTIAYMTDGSHRVQSITWAPDSAGVRHTRSYAYASGNDGGLCTPATTAGNTIVTDENGSGHTTTYCWDSLGRVVQTIDAMSPSHSTFTVWNSDNKATQITDPNGQLTTNTYDTTTGEKLLTTTGPTEGAFAGATTTYTYADPHNAFAPSKVVDSQGNTFNYTFDNSGNPATMSNGLGSQNVTTYAYTLDGLFKYVQDAKGNTRCQDDTGYRYWSQCMEYDSNGAVTSSAALAATDSYTNDGASRVLTHTDGNSKVTSYTYDPLDRVTQILYNGATSCPAPSATCTQFHYDADGNLQWEKDATGTSSFSYDNLNRKITDAPSGGGSSSSYTYDGVGNILTITNGLGASNIIHYHYDNNNRNDQLWLGNSSSTCGSTPATCTTFDYDAAGNRLHTYYPSATGTTIAMTYDNASKLLTVTATKGQTTLTSWQNNYINTSLGTYGADTNVRTFEQNNVSNASWQYAYDQLDRLSKVTPNGQGAQYSAYDSVSNGCGRTDGSACQGSTDPIRFNSANEMTYNNGINYVDDNSGNMTNWSITGGDYGSLSYNPQGQMTQLTHNTGVTINYAYRGAGQSDRASATQTVPPTWTQTWSSDLLGVGTETNTAQGECPCYYIHDPNGVLVESVYTTGTYFPLYDGEGSVVELIDSNGNQADTMTYSAQGVETASTGAVYEPWLFQGQYMDYGTGGSQQYHQGERYRQVGWMAGTWNQQDSASNPFETHGWNRLDYAGQDSLNLSDPNGILFGWSCDWCGRAASKVRKVVTQVVTHPIQALAGCWGAVRVNLIAAGQVPVVLAAESTVPGGILTVSAAACLGGAVVGGYGTTIVSSGISTRPPVPQG